MVTEVRNYFRYLDLVREDIKEEFDLLGINQKKPRICDFGCGNGLTTFGLAIERKESECIGVDLFGKATKITPKEIAQIIETVSSECKNKSKYLQEICELIETSRIPKFQQGNIVNNINLPKDIDLAYCKKVLVNIFLKEYESIPSGEQSLTAGLRNIYHSLRPDGQLCVIEYYKDFILEIYFEKCGFQIEKKELIKRREIRSKGKTESMSDLTLYLCRKR